MAGAVLLVGLLLVGCGAKGVPRGGGTGSAAAPTSPNLAQLAASPSPSPPPAGFVPATVSFATPLIGYALGAAPCLGRGTGLCASLVASVDAGQHWVARTTPAVVVTDPYHRPVLRFADALDGYVTAGGELYATHDGGVRWEMVELPDNADPRVAAVELGGGLVEVVAGDGGSAQLTLYRSPVEVDAFGEVPTVRLAGTGAVIDLAVADGAAWLIADPAGAGQRATAYATSDGLTWHQQPLPCRAGESATAAVYAGDVAITCQATPTATGATKRVWTSSDHGRHFTRVGAPAATGYVAGLALPAPATVVVAATADTDALYRSADAGATFAVVYTSEGDGSGGGLGLADLAFSDSTHGSVVLGDTGLYARDQAQGSHDVPAPRLLVTIDGGAHWVQVVIQA